MTSKTEIEEIKSRLSIVDVVQGYLPLRKAGRNFQALCPFHSEKSPSFMVNPTLNIYKCFGCAESGDIFSFVQKIENCSFPEALETLAAKAGVQLTQQHRDDGAEDKKAQLFRLNQQAAEIFQHFLEEPRTGEQARSYLESRGITATTSKSFMLGYAPDSWDSLLHQMVNKGYTASTLEQMGLVIKSEKGDRYYDRFRNRLVFPVLDQKERICGFSARALTSDYTGGKYINSPETELFSKSELLYGLHRAQGKARLEEEMILVEGNFDVITLHQAGIENVVAPLGTALTSSQLRLIKRLAQRLIIAFDGDSAGMKATIRGLSLAENEGLDVRVIQLPEGQDPDSCVRSDLTCWMKGKNSALPVLEFLLDRVFMTSDISTALGKSNAAKQALGLIVQLQSMVSRMFYLEKVSLRLSIPVRTLMDEAEKSVTASRPVSPTARGNTDGPRLDSTEVELVRLIISFPFLLGRLQGIDPAWFTSLEVGTIFHALRACSPEDFKSENFYDTLSAIQQSILSGAVFAWQGNTEQDAEPEAIFQALVYRLESKALRREMDTLGSKVAQTEDQEDSVALAQLLGRQQLLKNRLSEIDQMADEKES